MFTLDNQTDYQAALYPGWSAAGIFQYTLVIKHGWQYLPDGRLKTPKKAETIAQTDRYYGKPLNSSIAQASEIMPYKATAEWLLTGSIKQTKKQQTLNVVITNQQQRLKKSLLIDFTHTDLKLLPLRYEYAKRSLKNPVGVPPHLHAPLRTAVLKKDMAAFSAIAPFWSGRLKYGKQVTSAAVEQSVHGDNAPSLLHNVAPKEQQFRHFFVGEQQVMLAGFHDHTIHLNVPAIKFSVQSQGELEKTFHTDCDTLTINTATHTIYKLWRCAIPAFIDKELRDTIVLREVVNG